MGRKNLAFLLQQGRLNSPSQSPPPSPQSVPSLKAPIHTAHHWACGRPKIHGSRMTSCTSHSNMSSPSRFCLWTLLKPLRHICGDHHHSHPCLHVSYGLPTFMRKVVCKFLCPYTKAEAVRSRGTMATRCPSDQVIL